MPSEPNRTFDASEADREQMPSTRTLRGRLARRLLRCPDPTSDNWQLVYETTDRTCWWHSDYELTVVSITENGKWRSAVQPHGEEEDEAAIRLTPTPTSRKTAEYLCVQYMDHGIAPVGSGIEYKSLLPPRLSAEQERTNAE